MASLALSDSLWAAFVLLGLIALAWTVQGRKRLHLARARVPASRLSLWRRQPLSRRVLASITREDQGAYSSGERSQEDLAHAIASIVKLALGRQEQQERILLALLRAVGGVTGSLWLISPDRGAVIAEAEVNLGEKHITPVTGIRLAISADPLIRRLQSSDKPVHIDDLTEQEKSGSFFAGLGLTDLVMLPLMQRGDLTGFLILATDNPGEEIDLVNHTDLQKTSVLLSAIAENWRLQDAEIEEGRRMQTLAELSATLTARRRLTAVLPEIVATGRDLARSLTCTLMLVNQKQGVIEMAAGVGVGLDEFPGSAIPLQHPVVASFLGQAEPLIVRDIDRDMPQLRPLLLRPDVQSIQIYPLKISNEVIGAITIGHDHRRSPSDTEANLADTLASVAAAAIQNARAFEAELEHIKLITTVSAISRRVSGILDTEWMLQEVCSLLSLELEYSFVHAFLVNESGDGLRYIAGSSPTGPVILDDFELVSLEESQVGLAARTGQAQMRQPSPSDPFHSRLDIEQVGSELVVPISAHNRVVGVIAVQSESESAFDEEDLQLLTIVTDQLSIALDNARHHAQVREQARLDSLTQVLNHGTFVNALHELVRSSRESGQPLSLIMLDVDYFKEYNDQFGHVAGDAALKATVQAIEANIKARDLVGRWGGEEFGIGMLGATKEQARMVAERIRTTLASLVPVDRLGREMPPPSVSQGIATLDEDADNADQLVDEADRALYAAKEHGRDQVRIAGQI